MNYGFLCIYKPGHRAVPVALLSEEPVILQFCSLLIHQFLGAVKILLSEAPEKVTFNKINVQLSKSLHLTMEIAGQT